MTVATCVEVYVPAPDAELVCDALWGAGARAVAVEDRGGGPVRVVGGFGDDRRAGRLAAESVRRRWRARLFEVADEEWADAWRAHASRVRAGRLVVEPSWLGTGRLRPGDIVLRIDPGRTFGSGSHPSTRLALVALDGLVTRGSSVLDVGCGSGVLSVAAALLGASAVRAVDTDPAAVAATVDNARRNGVEATVTASLTAASAVEDSFDVVVANLGGAAAVVDLAPALARATAPGGTLVISGLLTGQVDEVVAAFDPAPVRGSLTEGDWRAVVLTPR